MTASVWPPHGGEMAGRIRAHDWAATPLGPIENWPDRLRAVVELVLASPVVATVALLGSRLLIYTDVAARLYGERHPDALGRSLGEAFADSYPAVAPFYDQVFKGESVTVRAQPLAVGTGEGSEVFDAYLTPVWGPDGAVIGAHMVGLEISDLMREKAAREESEARLVADLTGMRRMHALHVRLTDSKDLDTALQEIVAAAADVAGTERSVLQLVSTDGAPGVRRAAPRHRPRNNPGRGNARRSGCRRNSRSSPRKAAPARRRFRETGRSPTSATPHRVTGVPG